jgi:hypothetical protein
MNLTTSFDDNNPLQCSMEDNKKKTHFSDPPINSFLTDAFFPSRMVTRSQKDSKLFVPKLGPRRKRRNADDIIFEIAREYLLKCWRSSSADDGSDLQALEQQVGNLEADAIIGKGERFQALHFNQVQVREVEMMMHEWKLMENEPEILPFVMDSIGNYFVSVASAINFQFITDEVILKFKQLSTQN